MTIDKANSFGFAKDSADRNNATAKTRSAECLTRGRVARIVYLFPAHSTCNAIARIIRQHHLSLPAKKFRSVKRHWWLFGLLSTNSKYLQDIHHYWPQSIRLKSPRFQFTAQEPFCGDCFITSTVRTELFTDSTKIVSSLIGAVLNLETSQPPPTSQFLLAKTLLRVMIYPAFSESRHF